VAGNGGEHARKRSKGSPWKVDAAEVPPELRDNAIVDFLVNLTPDEERVLEELAELDRRGPPPDVATDGDDDDV
jgi:hypothetical protein